ncbi:hypothetical protein ACSJHY_23365, partial [Escherichia coli]
MITNLDSMPSNEPYLWADYIEILALTNIDRSFSRGDLYSTLQAQPEAVLAETDEAEEEGVYDVDDENDTPVRGFAPIFPDICYHLTHYKPAA